MKLKRAPAACLVRFARRPEVIGYGAGWNTRVDARSAPCGHPPVAAVESGERRLDVVEFFELAEALGVNPVALFERVARW